MGPAILSFEDREYVLRILKERENAIMAEVDSQRKKLTQLDTSYGELSEGLRDGFDELRAGFDRLSSAVLQHVQYEAEADSRRDATIGAQGAAIASLAAAAGGSAGATAGRGAGAKWGGLVSALVAGALMALAQLLGIGK